MTPPHCPKPWGVVPSFKLIQATSWPLASTTAFKAPNSELDDTTAGLVDTTAGLEDTTAGLEDTAAGFFVDAPFDAAPRDLKAL